MKRDVSGCPAKQPWRNVTRKWAVANPKGVLALTNHVLRSARKTRQGESAVTAVANIATGWKAETVGTGATGATGAIVVTADAADDLTGVDAGQSAAESSVASPEKDVGTAD